MIAETHRADRADHAESAFLGAIAVMPDLLDEAASGLLPSDFAIDSHRLVFEAFLQLRANGTPIDVIAVAKHLKSMDRMEDVGGANGLQRLMESTPDVHNAGYYASLIIEASNRRKLGEACAVASAKVRSNAADFEEIMGAHERDLHAINERSSGIQAVECHEAFQELLADLDSESGVEVETGWMSLDSTMFGGFRGGQLIIIAARPSVGKTALSCGMILNMAQAERHVLFCSLEMNRKEIAARFASTLSEIPCSEIASKSLNDLQKSRLIEAGNMMISLPISIDDNARRTVSQIAALARVQKRKRRLDVIFVDYLQLIQPEDSRATRDQQVSAMSRGLKCLAKDMNVPVVCLAQLNRDIEKRENKRPRLSDLRESGAIEQDADIVMFLDRPATYDRSADPKEANVIIAKHRNGPTGTAGLVWDPELMTFRDLSDAWKYS